MGEEGQQVGFDLRLEFVLPRLAGEDDDEGKAEVLEDAPDNGAGDFNLIGAQGDTAAAAGEAFH